MPQAMIAAHADWSAHPAKRWITIASRTRHGWFADAPVPVSDPAARVAALLADGSAVVLGLDLPLGLPRGYAACRPEADFLTFLSGLTAASDFFRVNETLATVGAARPFYPMRGVRGMTRAAHAHALGLDGPHGLSRLCDRATATRPAGAPLFWTLGANQTGKAAIAAWRDWLVPALAMGSPITLWPFAGPLHDLVRPGRAVLAEVYPAEAMRHAGIALRGSKRATVARREVAPALHAALAARGIAASPALTEAIETGFGHDAAGEDRFDSVLGLLGLIGVLNGQRPDFVPDDPWVRRWEGWVLGQTELPSGLSGGAAAAASTPARSPRPSCRSP